MNMKEMGADERPREKMLAFGPGVLSNAELLAILLRTGTGKENALDVSRNLLRAAGGSLTELSSMTVTGMKLIPGIGRLKAATVMAAFELGRRFAFEEFPYEKTPLTSAAEVYRLMFSTLKGLDHEQCWVVYLNRSNFVIDKVKISDGGFNETTVDVQMIIRGALERKAAGLVLVHNHPSGNPQPGKMDIVLTGRLSRAAKVMNISVIDHIIFSDSAYYSFEEETLHEI